MWLSSHFFLRCDDLRGHVLFWKSKEDGEGLSKYIGLWREREINVYWVRHWDLGGLLCSTHEQEWPCLAHVQVNREKQTRKRGVDIQRQKTEVRSHVNQDRWTKSSWILSWGLLLLGPRAVYHVPLPLLSSTYRNVLQSFHVWGTIYSKLLLLMTKKSLANSTHYG